MSNVAGIDYSMSCPSIVVKDGKEYHYYYLIGKRKYEGTFDHNIKGVLKSEWDSPEERFDAISEWAIKILKHHNVKFVCLEGYAMGAKGQVFNIGENTGLLKNKMYKEDIAFYTPTPSEVKKYVRSHIPEDKQRVPNPKPGGKPVLVKMDKERIITEFFKDTGICLYDAVGLKEGAKDLHPIEDIADAYFMCKLADINIPQ